MVEKTKQNKTKKQSPTEKTMQKNKIELPVPMFL